MTSLRENYRHPLVIRNEEWMPYENDMLKALNEFHGNRLSGRDIQACFPEKTVEECESRQMGFLIETLRSKKNGEEDPDTPHQLAEKPDSLESIPLEPFTIICSYLSAQTVFRKLPLVCKHFNRMLKKYQVPVKSAKIGHHMAEEVLLVQYLKRISHCQKLTLDVLSPHSTKRSMKMEKRLQLLDQLKPSLRELRCHTDWLPQYTSFLATSSQIRIVRWVYFNSEKPWTWNPLLKCYSLRSLTLEYPPNDPSFIRDLLSMLPNLEDLEIRAYFPEHLGLDEEIEWTNKAANLKTVRGEFLPPPELLTNLETLDINILTRRSWNRLLSMLPKLKNLKTLKIHSRDELLVTFEGHHQWRKISKILAFMLFHAISNNPSINHVEYGYYLDEEPYWDTPLEGWIRNLPATVKRIVYFDQTIRPEGNGL
jgi:hypothetical protein